MASSRDENVLGASNFLKAAPPSCDIAWLRMITPKARLVVAVDVGPDKRKTNIEDASTRRDCHLQSDAAAQAHGGVRHGSVESVPLPAKRAAI
jgi:hypothetical protein